VNHLPALLLLGGGMPIWNYGVLVGSSGVSGAVSCQNDHASRKGTPKRRAFPSGSGIALEQPNFGRSRRVTPVQLSDERVTPMS